MKPILTRKQSAVFDLILKGKCNKQIARVLAVTVKCVKYHKTNIFKMYKVDGTAALIRKFLAGGAR